jgi:hypothetical protein
MTTNEIKKDTDFEKELKRIKGKVFSDLEYAEHWAKWAFQKASLIAIKSTQGRIVDKFGIEIARSITLYAKKQGVL